MHTETLTHRQDQSTAQWQSLLRSALARNDMVACNL